MSREQIIEKIEACSSEELAKISELIEQLDVKRRKRRTPEQLFGAWADMDDELFNELINGVHQDRNLPEDDISKHKGT